MKTKAALVWVLVVMAAVPIADGLLVDYRIDLKFTMVSVPAFASRLWDPAGEASMGPTKYASIMTGVMSDEVLFYFVPGTSTCTAADFEDRPQDPGDATIYERTTSQGYLDGRTSVAWVLNGPSLDIFPAKLCMRITPKSDTTGRKLCNLYAEKRNYNYYLELHLDRNSVIIPPGQADNVDYTWVWTNPYCGWLQTEMWFPSAQGLIGIDSPDLYYTLGTAGAGLVE